MEEENMEEEEEEKMEEEENKEQTKEQKKEEDLSKTIFIKNISYEMSEEEFRNFYKQFG